MYVSETIVSSKQFQNCAHIRKYPVRRLVWIISSYFLPIYQRSSLQLGDLKAFKIPDFMRVKVKKYMDLYRTDRNVQRQEQGENSSDTEENWPQENVREGEGRRYQVSCQTGNHGDVLTSIFNHVILPNFGNEFVKWSRLVRE